MVKEGDLVKVMREPDLYAVVDKVVEREDGSGGDGVMTFVDTVYLLHFEQPYPAGRRPQHYLGHADAGRFAKRITEHRKGSNKARLTQVFAELGIPFVIARTWTGDYELEKELKRRKAPKRLCPICTLTAKPIIQPPDSVTPRERVVCSSCGKRGEWFTFDASGRCTECQP